MAKGLKGMGVKYACYSCDGKFYDLNRPEPICPRCGANQNEAPAKKVGRSAASSGDAAEDKALAKDDRDSGADDVLPSDAIPADAVDADFDDDVDIDAEFLDDEEDTF